MYKLNYSILKEMLKKNLTGKEIDFILWLTERQSEKGIIEGVYYKEVMTDLEISHQTFYDLISSLKEKGFILTKKEDYSDIDILLLNNDFSLYKDEDYKGKKVRYLSTNRKIFKDVRFQGLKAHCKMMVMDLVNIAGANRGFYKIGRKQFVEKYAEILQISKRVVRSYIKYLQLFFHIHLDDCKYIFKARSKMMGKITGILETAKAEREKYQEALLKTVLRRTHIFEYSEKEYLDTKGLLTQYKQYLHQISLTNIIKEMICLMNESFPKREWKYFLKASLVHRLIREEVKLCLL